MFKIPVETKPALWGAVGGAVALAIVGFTWGGWVSAKTALEQANRHAEAAVVSALAPICADKFRQNTNVEANTAAMKKLETWQQSNFVKDGGWATFAGTENSNSEIADACAKLLGMPKKA
jgi:hypothetical protein